MHDVAVALDRHQLVHLLGAEAHDASHVVAGQVDQHDVLGQLLGVLGQLPLEEPVVVLVLPTGPRTGDGPGDDDAVAQPHHRLGRRTDDGDLGEAQEVHVGARIEQAQGAVDVVGVGTEREVEALREHDLKDVPGPDVLLGHLDRRLVGRRADRPRRLGLLQFRRRCGHQRRRSRALSGPGAVRRQFEEPGAGGLVGRRDRLGVDHATGRVGHHHVVHQHDPLAPVVEGAELADDDERRVGVAEVVRRRLGEALDLAHHVVAEIPDQPPVQRRQPGERRRLEARHQGLHGGQDAVVRARHTEAPRRLHARPPRRQRGEGAAPHEGVAAPPLAALDRLEEEAVPLPHDVGEAGDRRQRVGHHLAPDRHDRVLLGQRRELGGVRVEGRRPPARAGAASGRHGAGTPGPAPMVR